MFCFEIPNFLDLRIWHFDSEFLCIQNLCCVTCFYFIAVWNLIAILRNIFQ